MAAEEELTIDEAADLLNVSVPYVRELLGGGDLLSLDPAHVTSHLGVDRARRLAAVDALASEAQELGIY